MNNPRLVLIPVALCALLRPADWAPFRGPNGSGHAPDKDVPVKWTDDNFVFKTPLPGDGHSPPIVCKGKVFLLSATNKQRMISCFDATSGKEVWTKKVPGDVAKKHLKSSFASATPCSDGERVYCVFWDGSNVGLYAYDFDGKLAWERDLGKFTSQHGPGFSPIVHNGLVIVNNDQDGASNLQAFFAASGKPAWDVKRPPFRACYSTPFILDGKDGPELVVGS